MLLTGDLAKEVAAILREILAHPTKKLYDVHHSITCCAPIIGCSPSTKELLHSSSRYCLRFAKPRYTERTLKRVQFSRFTPFCFRDVITGGLPRNKYLIKSGFYKKHPINGQYNLLSPVSTHLTWSHTLALVLVLPSGFHQSHRSPFTSIPYLLRPRCFPCISPELSFAFFA